MNIEYKLLQIDDISLLDKVNQDVFDHQVNRNYCKAFLSNPCHHIAVALLNGEVIAMASAVDYVHPDKPPELWVNEVGVATEYQRQGVATQLLGTLFIHAQQFGCKEAWVLTEEENIAARKLYSSIGGQEIEKPVMVTFQLGDHEK